MMEPEKKPKGKLRLRNLFITGLIIILPLYITVILFKLVIGWLRGLLHDTFNLAFRLILGPFLGDFYDKIEWVFLFLIGLPIVLSFILFIGWAARRVFGKKVLQWAEDTVRRLPVLGGVYSGSKQLVDTILVRGRESYQRVVLVEYPRKGCWVIAFVTGESTQVIQRSVQEKAGNPEDTLLNVFVPTTPNPTSGFLVFFRKSDVIPLNISVEDGMKVVFSGGILEPSDEMHKLKKPDEPQLLPPGEVSHPPPSSSRQPSVPSPPTPAPYEPPDPQKTGEDE